MGVADLLRQSTLAEYARKIRSAPRAVILSRPLILSAMMYATAAIPLSEYESNEYPFLSAPARTSGLTQ